MGYDFGWISFILLTLFATLQFGNTEEDVDPYNSTNARLIKHLLSRYDKQIRPVSHPSDTVTVHISGAPYQIINVDQKRNLISISAHFLMIWKDVYLQWNPGHFKDAQYALLPASAVWTPEVFVYYSTDDDQTVVESVLNVQVNHTGYVHSFAPFKTETICPVDVKHFPFDQQHCVLVFGTWPPNGEGVQLNITGGGTDLDVEYFYDNQEWTMENFSLLYDNGTYAAGDTNAVAMHLIIARQSFYYVFNLVIPSALISILSVIGFHLPSASTSGRYTKSRLGMMTLLSMSVLLLSVVNEMPKFGFESVPGRKGSFSSVPLICVYYFSLLAIISLATITSSWLVVLEKQVIREGVPVYLKWLLIEEWQCWTWSNRSQASGKSNLRDSYGRPDATDSSELAQLTMRDDQARTAQSNLQKPQNEHPHGTNGQRPDGVGMGGHGDERLTEIWQQTQTNLAEAVALLKAIRAVLAEPLSQSAHPYAGKIVKRLESFCLIFYLLLIFIVLMMFFFWRTWYN